MAWSCINLAFLEALLLFRRNCTVSDRESHWATLHITKMSQEKAIGILIGVVPLPSHGVHMAGMLYVN